MMSKHSSHNQLTRRHFLATSAAASLAAISNRLQAAPSQPSAKAKTIGIQVGAISFVDEGVDKVLDNIQKLGQVNTIFLATFTYGRGIAGRQVPGQPLPDHGKQEYDLDFHGGNYATVHPQYYAGTMLKDTRAPDHGKLDILEKVLPKAHQRGMKVYCWYEDVFRGDLPNIQKLAEVDLYGRRVSTLCTYHPDYRNFLIGLTEDYCKSYDIDGVMWGSERQGPLHNAIGARHGGRPDPSRVACFCEFHQQEARDRGIDVDRAIRGYQQLDRYLQAALQGTRPGDGYFVEFWRILLEYPEILAWEKCWTDGKHQIYGDIYGAAKSSRRSVQVGFHIWHANSFSPFYRAEQNYEELARVADFLKIVMYNNCGGPRYVEYVNNIGSTIFRDVPPDELTAWNHHIMNYAEKAYGELTQSGLSSDYVTRETKRALEGVKSGCAIYPGIDIDIPTGDNQKKTSPEDVYQATRAALTAGADGLIFSRKYSEMRLANLSAGGRAVREFRGE